jgi:hypothetical protein
MIKPQAHTWLLLTNFSTCLMLLSGELETSRSAFVQQKERDCHNRTPG